MDCWRNLLIKMRGVIRGSDHRDRDPERGLNPAEGKDRSNPPRSPLPLTPQCNPKPSPFLSSSLNGCEEGEGGDGSRSLPVIFKQQKEDDKLTILQWAAC